MWRLKCLVLLLELFGLVQICEDGLLEKTKVGLRSRLQTNENNYPMFMDIPNAIVEENNDFEFAMPHPKPEKIIDARRPQVDELNNSIAGTLDCRHINDRFEDSSRPVVLTNVGPIRGLHNEEDHYSMFMGIPYATVDKNNPFGAAIPYPKFEGVFDAYDDTAICPQQEEYNNTITGTLDCLHLNIYVPDIASPIKKLPVLVWIYGGCFSIGFAGRYLYGPKFLMRHDIILVTLNYRVGPYGFMCLDTPEVPGNAGLKDQKMALEWVKNNIEAFLGDPDRITLYGMSAGAAAVDLLHMYGNQDHYDKLIIHSGTALFPGVISNPNLTAALRLAEELGFKTDDNNEAIKFLSTVDPHQLIETNLALGLTFGPCLEKQFDGVVRFIHEHPYSLKGPDASNKSVLLAYNCNEAQLTYSRELIPLESFPAFKDLIKKDLKTEFNFEPDKLRKMEAIVRQFYMGDQNFTEAIAWNLGEYTSDFQFIYPTIRSVKRFLDNGCRNVYNFIFSVEGERNFSKRRLNVSHLPFVAHADDMGYVFDISYMGTPNTEEQLAIDRMTTLWANFIKYGNPTPEVTELLPVIWEPVTNDTIPYLELDNAEVKVGSRYYHERMAFWDLFYEMNWKYQKGYQKTSDAAQLSLKHAWLLLPFLLLRYVF